MKPNEDFTKRSKARDIGRWYITRFVQKAAKELPEGTMLLDAGAGESVYRSFFIHCRYKAIDLAVGESKWNYQNLDYIAPLHDMPIPDSNFDAILCTQVLEHLEWPRESVKEMFRVLKPGGKLYMTVPMSHCEHQTPYDYFRYTSFGLESICKHAGFSSVEILPFGGLLTRWAYELPRVLGIFPAIRTSCGNLIPKNLVWLPVKVFTLVVVRILQSMLLACDRFDNKRNDPFGWSCVAKK